MGLGTMTNPIDKLKKIRSWDEIRTRGSQAVSAYREKISATGNEPTDEQFAELLDRNVIVLGPVTPESIWYHFYTNADRHFFASTRDRDVAAPAFRASFPSAAEQFVHSADTILSGHINLLGLENIYIGTEVDWHREPVSGIRSPMKHWKEFDDLDASESGDKKIVWELNRHQHFFTLGLAFWLTGDERYTDAFSGHLKSWMDQNPPGMGINWASSLEVSFRAMSWVWAIQFFRQSEHFSPELLQRAVKYLYLHGRHIEKYLSKYYSPNTHLTGEALGLYYLGTQLPFLERASAWRQLGEKILTDEVSRQIHDDGVYFEQSTWYQRYTVDFYLQFIVLRSLNDLDIEGVPPTALESRVESALEFMMHATRPDGTTPAIGDDDGGRALPLTSASAGDFRGTLGAGAAIMGRGDMKWVAEGSYEEIFWMFGPAGMHAFELVDEKAPEHTSRAFRTGGYYAMRDGWLATDNYVMVDCGPVGSLAGGHGHADALAVEVVLHGKNLLVDSGTYSYHESKALRDQFRSTAAHNTISLDGTSSSEPGNTFSWRSRADATAKAWISDDRFDYFEGIHNGFEQLDGSPIHERGILFLKNDYIVIRDLVRANGEHAPTLNYHFPAGTSLSIDREGGFAAGDDWRIFIVGDGGEISLSQSPVSTVHAVKQDAPHLTFAAAGRGTQEFFTFIVPVERGCAPPTLREVPVTCGRAFAIGYRGYTDLLMYNDNGSNGIETELFDSNFKITWARVGDAGDGPDEIVLIGGDSFRLGSVDILGGSGELEFAAMRKVGRGVNVRTAERRFRVSLPQA
ncbi:MAG: alginate lyase family protein [Acidobacteriota bacterium]